MRMISDAASASGPPPPSFAFESTSVWERAVKSFDEALAAAPGATKGEPLDSGA